MANNYIEYITDEDLFECIQELYKGYKLALGSKNLKAFIKNKIDPVKFIFDAKILDMSMEEYVQREVIRQSDKSISNYIGTFHENLLGKVAGYEKLAVGNSIDIRSIDGKVVAEVKNKHNTVKGEDNKSIFEKLENIVEDQGNEVEKAFYVRIIDTKSQNKKWKFSSNNTPYEHENVYIVSGDKFYEFVTGRPDAFAELCSILPKAFNDFVSALPEEERIALEDSTVIEEIKNYYNNDNHVTDKEFLTRLFKINFAKYNGFSDFKIKD